MSEICEIGKCRQNAVTESMSRAREMYDTLQKNDQCEENETIDKKFSEKPTRNNYNKLALLIAFEL